MRILEVAERLFAERGLDGVSMRDITSEAETDLGLVNYHFTSKDGLFETVLARRIDELSRLRNERIEALGGIFTLPDVIAVFLEPLHERLGSNDAGWRYYAELASHVANMRRYNQFRTLHLDNTARAVIDALQQVFPAARHEALYWSYIFLVSGLAQVMTGSDRLTILSDGLCDLRDIDTAFAELHDFCVAGIAALVSK